MESKRTKRRKAAKVVESLMDVTGYDSSEGLYKVIFTIHTNMLSLTNSRS